MYFPVRFRCVIRSPCVVRLVRSMVAQTLTDPIDLTLQRIPARVSGTYLPQAFTAVLHENVNSESLR